MKRGKYSKGHVAMRNVVAVGANGDDSVTLSCGHRHHAFRRLTVGDCVACRECDHRERPGAYERASLGMPVPIPRHQQRRK